METYGCRREIVRGCGVVVRSSLSICVATMLRFDIMARADRLDVHLYRASTLYTRTDLKDFLSSYFTTHDLVSRVDQQYIDTHADAALRAVLSSKPLGGSASVSASNQSSTGTGEWARRDDVLDGLCARMQAWYRIEKGGEEPITRYACFFSLSFSSPLSMFPVTTKTDYPTLPFCVDACMRKQ